MEVVEDDDMMPTSDWLNEESANGPEEGSGEKMVLNPTYVRERIDVIIQYLYVWYSQIIFHLECPCNSARFTK